MTAFPFCRPGNKKQEYCELAGLVNGEEEKKKLR